MLILIPANVVNRDPITGEAVLRPDGRPDVISCAWWLESIVLADPRWSYNFKALRSATSVDRKFKGCAPGDRIELELADWELLREIAESPRYMTRDERGGTVAMPGYANPLLGRLAFPFIEAIVTAEGA